MFRHAAHFPIAAKLSTTNCTVPLSLLNTADIDTTLNLTRASTATRLRKLAVDRLLGQSMIHVFSPPQPHETVSLTSVRPHVCYEGIIMCVLNIFIGHGEYCIDHVSVRQTVYV